MKKIKSLNLRKRQHYFYQFFFIIVIFLLCFKGIFVKAGMMDSKLEKNRLEGIYAIAKYNGEEHLYYLNMYTLNGVVSYCIELGRDITTDYYHSTEDFGLSYLSKESKEYVQSIAYFGYLYPGHESYFYYMAAQELIWEYLSRGEISWTNVLDIHGEEIDIESYKREILNLRNWYYQGLSLRFNNDTTFAIGDVFDVYVGSGDLSLYEVSSQSYSEVSKENDHIRVRVPVDYVGRDEIILKRKQAYSYASKFYYYDNSQQLISVGNFLEDTKEIRFQIQGKDMTFQVIDGETKESTPFGQASFEGATYQLYDDTNQFLEEFSVNEYGKGYVSNLGYGNYIIRQVRESLGYQINESEVFVSFGQDEMPVLLEEYPYYETVEIHKRYNFENNGQLKEEENIQFEILDYDGKSLGIITTNELGVASIRLPYGVYTIRQINTLFGYKKVEEVSFRINKQGSGQSTINLTDDYIICKLKLRLIDLEFQEKIKSNAFSYRIYSFSKDKYLEVNGKDVFQSDLSGELLFPLLLGYGDYRLEEVTVDSDYVFQKQNIEFTIDDYSNMTLEDGYLLNTMDIFQKRIKKEVKVYTKKEIFKMGDNQYWYEKKARGGVLLSLVSATDKKWYDKTLYHEGEVIDIISTDKDGEKEFSLYLGDYCLVDGETKEEKCFSLTDKDNKMEIEFLTKEKRLSIVYHNQDSNQENIEGSVVEVISNGKKIYTGLTSEDGTFKVKDLKDGEYCFLQKKVSKKYLLSKEKQCISIDSTKEVWDVYMMNQINSSVIQVPDTLEEKKEIGKVIAIVLLIVVGGILYQKKIYSLLFRK